MNLAAIIPTNEIDNLTMTVTNAIDLVADGQIAEGYAALVWVLHRANLSALYGPL